ncbi:1-aminocyclopropane-1-carboxylate deaminase/D-cysteine desulfhydrase [Acinetobacter larvae]|uniref:1-aminocyclopropane-1-carboxylate deaminase n=1 Tax=Acinetobacter larvae TaxID=1789224 RepID=A0A1B2LX89_9GAMM|nr:pyridoxal-phosphate dependent enzyme [Acinetobacter larvae]AOA57393.1 1-aminocyclopropane-1-carboxylate deaminase [Acinetobacter larvae]
MSNPQSAPDTAHILQRFQQIAQQIPYQDLGEIAGVQLGIKRLDCIHPQISGNKFFKLKYNLVAARAQGYRQLLTFGGAYSNHIAATAYAAQLFGFDSIGIIRGEELAERPRNATLHHAEQLGMSLNFVSRENYRQKQQPSYMAQLQRHYPDAYILPEGGSNLLAVQGCEEILSAQDRENYDVICCAVGTGSTLAGLIRASDTRQQVLGFSALKGCFQADSIQQYTRAQHWRLTDDYCGGGYAKSSTELRAFMQDFEARYQIPLEQVYTAKMCYGVIDLIQQGYFPTASRILLLHTGGLQGRNI